MEDITHKLLVSMGSKWLRKYCYIVTTEIAGACSEEPDVFGWGSRGSYVIECKTNRVDFYSDLKKLHRLSSNKFGGGMGNYRYYLAPKGLLSKEDIEKFCPIWGLLEVNNGKIRAKRQPTFIVDKAYGWELALATSIIRRIGQTNIESCCVKAYTYETKKKGTVGILKD